MIGVDLLALCVQSTVITVGCEEQPGTRVEYSQVGTWQPRKSTTARSDVNSKEGTPVRTSRTRPTMGVTDDGERMASIPICQGSVEGSTV